MKKCRILVIEDNRANLELAQFLLQRAGFAVEWAPTAPEGIEMAKNSPPALIVMDIGLPGMDGLKATRILKGDPITAGIPVLALTANAMAGDRDRCLSTGCDGYIAKPINTRDFINIVMRHVAAQGYGHG